MLTLVLDKKHHCRQSHLDTSIQWVQIDFYFFFKSSEIQLESFSPQVQGHCFIHFAFSVLNIWLSNENIPSSWIAFSILFSRSIFNPQMEMTDELWKVNIRSIIWPFPNAQKYFIACISTKCLIWKCFLF